jgi:hypothetical protein
MSLGGLGTKEQLLLCVAEIKNGCFSPSRSSKAEEEQRKNNRILITKKEQRCPFEICKWCKAWLDSL